MQLDPSIPAAGRVLGALVFAVAVAGKLRHYTEFTGVVANYRLLPAALATPVAGLVIALETAVAVSLALGVWLAAGALLGIALLGAFTVAMGINLARGRLTIDCGCFQSALRQRLNAGLVVRNLVLMLALLPALAAGAQPFSVLQALDGLGAGLALFFIYQAASELLAARGVAAAVG